jgi:Holliday junction resolvasome RuvABC endonuclease subunit
MTEQQVTNGFYLSFDQALSNTGWVVGYLNGGELQIIDHGVHKTYPKDPKGEEVPEQDRILSIEGKVKELVNEFKPLKCYTEAVFLRKKTPNQGKVLVKIESTIHNLVSNFVIPYTVINSSSKFSNSWRHQLNIPKKNGGKSKTAKKLNVENLTEHSADALAILLTGLLNDGLLSRESVDNFLIPDEEVRVPS